MKKIEIQIRTEPMHEYAEKDNIIWKYKSSEKG